MITSSNTVIKINSFNLSGKAQISICAKKTITAVRLTVASKDERYSYRFDGGENSVTGEFFIPNVRLWTLRDSFLYSFEAEIEYADGSEKACGTFGFRTVTHNKDYVVFNGDELYIRGYIRGARAHEHLNLLGCSNEEYYRKNIRTAKEYGFNLIRFHSVVPDDDFFKVADEEGILVHLELRMPDDDYNNLEEMLHSKKDLIPDEFIRQTVDKLYNHPSLIVYCIGNEIKGLASGSRVLEIGELIKTLDPSRLYLDTCAWGEAGRPFVDIDVQHMAYYFPFGKHADMFAKTENLLVVGSSEHALTAAGENSSASVVINHNVPLIAHEVCHYVALRDFESLKRKFIEYKQPLPWWIDEELKLIEQKGYKQDFQKRYFASKYFQKECWKTAFEAMRASKILGGFHFLQFADTDMYENSNGVVDCFDDPTYVTKEEFLTFNGDKVLLNNLDGRILQGGKTQEVIVSLSSCGNKLADYADFTYTLKAGSEIVCQGKLPHINVSQNGVYDICKLSLRLPTLDEAKEVRFSVELTAEGKTIAQNGWNLWIFPPQAPVSYQEFTTYERENVIVTDDIERAFAQLKEGKKVCLVYRQKWTRHLLDKQMASPKFAFKATWSRFKPVIWDRGTNFGGLCNAALLTKHGFATSEIYDFNYSVLTEDCDKVVLDDFPVTPTVLISGTDKHCRDRFDAYKVSFNLPELMPDRTLRNFGYLFELKVDGGSLLVCGLNMTGLDESEPSTVAMARCILSYLHSEEFSPTAETSLERLKTYMQKCAEKPIKERMMTQFWQFDCEPVESKKYWEESRAYLIEKE